MSDRRSLTKTADKQATQPMRPLDRPPGGSILKSREKLTNKSSNNQPKSARIETVVRDEEKDRDQNSVLAMLNDNDDDDLGSSSFKDSYVSQKSRINRLIQLIDSDPASVLNDYEVKNPSRRVSDARQGPVLYSSDNRDDSPTSPPKANISFNNTRNVGSVASDVTNPKVEHSGASTTNSFNPYSNDIIDSYISNGSRRSRSTGNGLRDKFEGLENKYNQRNSSPSMQINFGQGNASGGVSTGLNNSEFQNKQRRSSSSSSPSNKSFTAGENELDRASDSSDGDEPNTTDKGDFSDIRFNDPRFGNPEFQLFGIDSLKSDLLALIDRQNEKINKIEMTYANNEEKYADKIEELGRDFSRLRDQFLSFQEATNEQISVVYNNEMQIQNDYSFEKFEEHFQKLVNVEKTIRVEVESQLDKLFHKNNNINELKDNIAKEFELVNEKLNEFSGKAKSLSECDDEFKVELREIKAALATFFAQSASIKQNEMKLREDMNTLTANHLDLEKQIKLVYRFRDDEEYSSTRHIVNSSEYNLAMTNLKNNSENLKSLFNSQSTQDWNSNKTVFNEAYKQFLIDNPEAINQRDENGLTPLTKAVSNATYEFCSFLIGQGADVNLKNAADVTPLMIAAWDGKREICELLVENGADLDAVDGLDRTCIDYAKLKNRHKIVEYLTSLIE